jgi:hypothetical protein
VTSPGGGDVSSAVRDTMRFKLVVGCLIALGLAGSVAWPVAGAVSAGRLAGLTQITYGCPGPVRVGSPPCEHWSVFPNASFTVTKPGTGGESIAGSKRLVGSDVHGSFVVVLPVGSYLLRPLPQAHTHGGISIRVWIRANTQTRVLVRFEGFPQML